MSIVTSGVGFSIRLSLIWCGCLSSSLLVWFSVVVCMGCSILLDVGSGGTETDAGAGWLFGIGVGVTSGP